MGISPNMTENLALELVRIYAQAERDMLSRISNKLKRDTSLSISQWEQKKTAELRELKNGVKMHIVDKLKNVDEKEVKKIIEKATKRGADSAVADLRKALPEDEIPVKHGLNQANRRAIETHAKALKDKLDSTHLRIMRTTDDVYKKAVNRGVEYALTGSGTRREGAQKALNQLANRGVTGFQDSAGRSWNLSSYCEMATRTQTANASREAHMQRVQENGRDLVVVSSHAESCEICDPWEGQVLSISGDDDRYPSVDEAVSEGLHHPNCGHHLTAYIEGLTEPPEPIEGEENYEDRQEQRYLERGVRKWKRRKAGAVTEKEERKAQAKVSEWQGRLRDFEEETGRKRRYEREQIEQAR